MNAGDVRETLGWARYYLGLYWPDISVILDCDKGKAEAWYSQEDNPGPEEMGRIEELQNLRELLRLNFGQNHDRVREWLNRRLTDFGSKTPLSLIRQYGICEAMPILSSTLPQNYTTAG